MRDILKAPPLEKLAIGLLIIYLIAFFWVLSASGRCGESGTILEQQGICLWRRLAGISCILVLETAFGIGAGLQARARKYPFWMGFLLGFFLNAIGAFFIMTLDPKGTPHPPVSKNRKILVAVIAAVTIVICLVTWLGNLASR